MKFKDKLKYFIIGMGSVLDIFPKPPTRKDIEFKIQSDEDAIRSDWEAVGKDMQKAMDTFAEREGLKKPGHDND